MSNRIVVMQSMLPHMNWRRRFLQSSKDKWSTTFDENGVRLPFWV